MRKGKRNGRVQTTKEYIWVICLHYPAFAKGLMNFTELAQEYGLSRPTVYKYLILVG